VVSLILFYIFNERKFLKITFLDFFCEVAKISPPKKNCLMFAFFEFLNISQKLSFKNSLDLQQKMPNN
jgi:hypothetical protein